MKNDLLYQAFGVSRGYEYVDTKYMDGCVEFILAVKNDQLICPECKSANVIRKGKRHRRLQTVPIGFQQVFLKAEVPQCECKDCGKTFEVSPPLPSRM